jgi:hypothetical protein
MAHLGGQFRLADGGWFRWTPATVLVELDGVPVDPPARSLHINDTTAVCFPPAGTAGLPWRVPLDQAAEIVERVNALRAKTGRPPVVLGRRFVRNARHVAAGRPAGTGSLPFPVVDAAGYPGLVHHNETLWVHRTTGAAVLEVDTTPERLTPTEAAATTPAKTYTRVGVRAAAAWLAREGYPFRPVELNRRQGVDDEPPPADPD